MIAIWKIFRHLWWYYTHPEIGGCSYSFQCTSAHLFTLLILFFIFRKVLFSLAPRIYFTFNLYLDTVRQFRDYRQRCLIERALNAELRAQRICKLFFFLFAHHLMRPLSIILIWSMIDIQKCKSIFTLVLTKQNLCKSIYWKTSMNYIF